MDTQGILNTVFAPGIPALSKRPSLRVTILNPTDSPPQLNPSFVDENGIWNDVFDPATNTIRISVV